MGDPKGKLVTPIAYNPSGLLRSLEVDVSDRLKVLIDAITGVVSVSIDGQTVDLVVKQLTASNMLTGINGWVNGAWQKSPIAFGASASVSDVLSSTTLPAGNSTIMGTEVPAGEVWCITQIAYRYVGTVAGVLLRPGAIIGGLSTVFGDQTGITSNVFYGKNLFLVLFPGDQMYYTINGATLNDDAYMSASGYRMDIDQ